MRRLKLNTCQFLNCRKQIHLNATMCSYHWRIFYYIRALKKNFGKTNTELLRLAAEKEKEYKQKKLDRSQGVKHVHAGKNA